MAEKSKESEEKFVRHKRVPQRHVPKQKNDIYVNKRSDFKCQLERSQKLLDSGYNEVYIHGLGAAINRAINLALQLQQKGHGSIELSAHTSSVQLVDDFEPLEDIMEGELDRKLTKPETMFAQLAMEQEGYTQQRTNSSVKIKVYKVHSDELATVQAR